MPPILEDPLAIEYILKKSFESRKGEIKIGEKPLISVDIVAKFLVNVKNYKEKMKFFNAGLKRIQQTGEYKKYWKNINFFLCFTIYSLIIFIIKIVFLFPFICNSYFLTFHFFSMLS